MALLRLGPCARQGVSAVPVHYLLERDGNRVRPLCLVKLPAGGTAALASERWRRQRAGAACPPAPARAAPECTRPHLLLQ